MSQNIGLYITSSQVTPNKHQNLQQIFDTAKDFPESKPKPDYVRLVPDSQWAENASITEIFARHRREQIRNFSAKPIVILDERTAEEKEGEETVLLVGPDVDENGDWRDEPVVLRFDPHRVPGAAINVQLSNQSMKEVRRT